MSSEEVPLSAKPAHNESKSKGNLHSRFYEMIKGDAELYLRILHYEVRVPNCLTSHHANDRDQPLSFDELISKSIATGISETGWKKKLKRFLDLQVCSLHLPRVQG